jgi:hypothetical protein
MTESYSADQFAKALDELIGLVAEGKSYVKIGRELGGVLWDNPALVRVAPRFWTASLSSMTFVAQMNAFKLFDKQAGTLTVPRLLENAEVLKGRFVHATPSEVDSIVSVARRQIARMLPDSYDKIESKRNNLLAHINQRIVTQRKNWENNWKLHFPM